MKKIYRKPSSTILFLEPECLLTLSREDSTLRPGNENTVIPDTEEDYHGDFQSRHRDTWNNN